MFHGVSSYVLTVADHFYQSPSSKRFGSMSRRDQTENRLCRQVRAFKVDSTAQVIRSSRRNEHCQIKTLRNFNYVCTAMIRFLAALLNTKKTSCRCIKWWDVTTSDTKFHQIHLSNTEGETRTNRRTYSYTCSPDTVQTFCKRVICDFAHHTQDLVLIRDANPPLHNYHSA
jgi:hypothetical protein